MTHKLVRLSKSCISDDEVAAVTAVLKDEYLGMGSHVQKFEIALETFFGSKVATVNTGTSAIQLALQAVGCTIGDEVLVPSLTYLATYQAISATGAKPISCDVNLSKGMLCIEDCKRKITQKTKAFIPVFYAGATDLLEEYLNFEDEVGIKCVFDAAHAFGSKLNNKIVGSGRGIYCFSFDGIKNITCGEGGCVVSQDDSVIQAVTTARQLGITDEHKAKYSGERLWTFDVDTQGWRYHLSNINASIGLVQLSRFNKLALRRQEIAKRYDCLLKDRRDIFLFSNDYDQTVPHIYVVKILGLKNRDQLRSDLRELNIETGVHYFPNHLLTLYKNDNLRLPNVESLFLGILTLPIHPDINDNDVDYVVQSLKSMLDNNNYYS
jgi:dTDP-4-amino-4,6-dideoxygalactose transaminase